MRKFRGVFFEMWIFIIWTRMWFFGRKNSRELRFEIFLRWVVNFLSKYWKLRYFEDTEPFIMCQLIFSIVSRRFAKSFLNDFVEFLRDENFILFRSRNPISYNSYRIQIFEVIDPWNLQLKFFLMVDKNN